MGIRRIITIEIGAKSESQMETKLRVFKNDITFLRGLYKDSNIEWNVKNLKVKEEIKNEP